MEPESRREAFRGRIFRVETEIWPAGRHDVVRHPGAAAVLPVTPGGEVVLVRQFRQAIRQVLTEVPAGLLDREGEDALSCGARELFEETGYRHVSIEFLGGIYSSAGFTDEYIHLFLAQVEAEPSGLPEAGIELSLQPFGESLWAAKTGRVRDAKTAIALLLAGERRSRS